MNKQIGRTLKYAGLGLFVVGCGALLMTPVAEASRCFIGSCSPGGAGKGKTTLPTVPVDPETEDPCAPYDCGTYEDGTVMKCSNCG